MWFNIQINMYCNTRARILTKIKSTRYYVHIYYVYCMPIIYVCVTMRLMFNSFKENRNQMGTRITDLNNEILH